MELKFPFCNRLIIALGTGNNSPYFAQLDRLYLSETIPDHKSQPITFSITIIFFIMQTFCFKPFSKENIFTLRLFRQARKFYYNYSFCFGVGLVLTVDGTVTAGSPVCVANCERIEDGNNGSCDQDTLNSHSDSRYQKSVIIYMLYKNVFNWLKLVLNN